MPPTLRHAVRSLRRAPALGIASVLCIGLGTAATASVATLVSATLLRPLPFEHADRLVRLWLDQPGVNSRVSFSIPEIADFAPISAFDGFVGTARVRVVALMNGGAERLRGEGVSRGYFQLLGVSAALGRTFTADDHAPGAPAVALLSHGTWARYFGADPAIVGRAFRTERAVYTIVGVTMPGFAGTVEDDVVEFFIPVEQYEPRTLITSRTTRISWLIARLKPGATGERAAAEAEAIRRAFAEEHPDIYGKLRMRVEPLGESWRENLRSGGGVLFAAASLLLMIAAINVGCLLLARVLDRRRELAICAALGAGQRRLMLQLFTEAGVLVAVGGAAGALAGPWLLDAFIAVSPVTLPSYVRLEPDAAAAALAIGILACAGLVAGTVPALLGRRVNSAEVLREGGRGTLGSRTTHRWGFVLIAGETALTLVLLVAGGLFIRSYERLSNMPLGFDRTGIARLAVTLNRSDVGDPSRLPALYDRLRHELIAVPGARRIGLVAPTLPPWDPDRAHISFGGLDPSEASEGVEVATHLVDGALFDTLGIRLLAGRNVTDADGPTTAPVAVISRSLAVRLGGVEKAVGRQLAFLPGGMTRGPSGAFTVVGVVENVGYDGLVEQDTRRYLQPGAAGDLRSSRYDVYTPLARFPQMVVSIGVATDGDAAALIDPLRRRIAAIAPASAVHWTSTMDDEIALEYAPARFYTLLVTAFSASALLLTSIGLFALLSHAAARRMGEIGLRLALGASRISAAGLLLRAGVTALAAGVAAGLITALLAARAVGGLLYGIAAFDRGAFVAAVGALLLVTFSAALLPLRRVARVDPVAALRSE